MHHFKSVLVIFVVALVAIWAANKISFVGSLVGQQ